MFLSIHIATDIVILNVNDGGDPIITRRHTQNVLRKHLFTFDFLSKTADFFSSKVHTLTKNCSICGAAV